MKSPAQFRTPYAARLRGVAAAGAIYDPTDDLAKTLHRQARALEAAVRVGADVVTSLLIGECRKTLTTMAAEARLLNAEPNPERLDPSGQMLDAVCLDARAALNRLAGMIRNNDPNPNDPEASR